MTRTALPPEQLYRACDPALLPFATTESLPDIEHPIGQDRAIAALSFGIGIDSEGFNLFALGPEGTGKTAVVRRLLDEEAAKRPAPDDWCYVNNFKDPHKPKALRLPPGQGPGFAKAMQTLIDDLRIAIVAAFEGDEYRTRKQVIEDQFKEKSEEAFGVVQKKAEQSHVALMRTPVGLALAPMKDGEVLSPEDFKALPEGEQAAFKTVMEELQAEMEATLKQMPRWEKEQRAKLRDLNREVTAHAVGHLIEELEKHYAGIQPVLDHLEAVREDVIDNVERFLNPAGGEGEGEGESPLPIPMRRPGANPFRRYQVNALVHQAEAPGAPVVFESHPTQPNLIGRIEHMSQFGALLTDFTLIKSGALHRANGGYLVIEARKLLMQPFAWEDLKRAMRSHQIRIEAPGQAWGLISTTTLEPEPIPLAVKVVLIGDPMLYYLLSHYDPEFSELFKVAADFDYRQGRDAPAVLGYAQLIATLVRREGLPHFERDAVARIVEHGARLSGDAEKLTTHLAAIADLVRESAHWARGAGHAVATRADVEKAIGEHEYRSDRVREHIQEDIRRGTLMIDVAGAKVGQVNGLAVFQLGRFAFGKPSRITCRVRLGKGEVIDIEREVDLGGPLHSKGVLILSAFLSSRFAKDSPLSLSASLVFEQSYGGVDGDSASSTELYALLSALAEAPIRQSLAVTGSVNQMGEVQAIGGVNEKIEGFFDVCKARGLTGDQGVLIPAANVRHLMLRPDVVEACRAGQFAIHPVASIDEGIAILTGIEAGEADAKGEYPLGSVNRRVANRLAALAAKVQELSGGRDRKGRDR
ncbi:MAG: AAA family ATPase [Rhodospirillales bacterium]|nr:AAA family ATPase [Rhodospirillales bacterium]